MKTKFKKLNGESYEASVEMITETLHSHGKEYSIFKMYKNKNCNRDMYYAVDKNGPVNQNIELYDSVGDILFDLDWRPYFNENLIASGYTSEDIIHMIDRNDSNFKSWWDSQFEEMIKIRKLCKSGKSFSDAVKEVKETIA